MAKAAKAKAAAPRSRRSSGEFGFESHAGSSGAAPPSGVKASVASVGGASSAPAHSGGHVSKGSSGSEFGFEGG